MTLMKIQSFFLLLPCLASIFWLLAYLLFASKGVAIRKMRRFLAVLSLFLLFTLLSQNDSSRLLLHFTLFKQVCALLLIPSYLSYIYSLKETKTKGVFFIIMNYIPYLHLIMGIVSVFSIGYDTALSILIDSYTFQGPMFPYLPDNSQMVFYATYTYIFKTFLLADFLLFSICLMSCVISGVCTIKDVGSFFFRGTKAPVKPVQLFVALLLFLILVSALILGKSSYIENVVLAALGSLFIAFLLSMIAFIGTVGGVESNSIRGILRTVRFGGESLPDEEFQDDAALSESVETTDHAADESGRKPDMFINSDSGLMNEDALNRLRDEISSKLSDLVEGEALYLKHDITLSSVADKMGVLKDELSDYLDYKYGLSFQNYINMLRINYAEKFLMSHDDVTQKEIALACGFSGASAFNSAFSKQKGVTPKIWKDRQLELQKNREA